MGYDGMANTELFMTPTEQLEAVREAGFGNCVELMRHGSLCLVGAEKEK